MLLYSSTHYSWTPAFDEQRLDHSLLHPFLWVWTPLRLHLEDQNPLLSPPFQCCDALLLDFNFIHDHQYHVSQSNNVRTYIYTCTVNLTWIFHRKWTTLTSFCKYSCSWVDRRDVTKGHLVSWVPFVRWKSHKVYIISLSDLVEPERVLIGRKVVVHWHHECFSRASEEGGEDAY